MIDSSDFELAKKRLALIMKHRLKDEKEQTPELRRSVTDKDGEPTDDRPVIKRAPSGK